MNKRLAIVCTAAIVSIVGLVSYFSNPYRGCDKLNQYAVGDSFSEAYDCGTHTRYIPKD